MSYQLVMIFSFSILLPGILAVVLFKKIDHRYYPFVFCLWIGCVNEILSFILIRNRMLTTANNNLYVLLEAVLLTWFFKEARIFERKQTFPILIFILITFWVAETFFFKTIHVTSTYFRIFYSMMIVFLSIRYINEILFDHDPEIIKNPDFFLCLCFIVYFVYKALIQSFVIYGLTRDMNFLKKIYDILIYVNLGVNLLYTLAVLWMPRKYKFTRP